MEEQKHRFKELTKMLDEIYIKENELRSNFNKNVNSIYEDNIDLIIDIVKSLKGEELMTLMRDLKQRYAPYHRLL